MTIYVYLDSILNSDPYSYIEANRLGGGVASSFFDPLGKKYIYVKIWFNNSIFGCLKALTFRKKSKFGHIWSLLQSFEAEKAISFRRLCLPDQARALSLNLAGGKDLTLHHIGSSYHARQDPDASFLKSWLRPCNCLENRSYSFSLYFII